MSDYEAASDTQEVGGEARGADRAMTAILQMAIVRDQRAIDRLLDVLACPTSEPDLFGRMLETGVWSDDLPPARSIAGEAPTLEVLVRLKDKGKWLTASAAGELDRLRGTALYALAVGAALAHHGRGISSAQEHELHPLLLDLAEVTAEPWKSLFAEAARRCRFAAGRGETPNDGVPR